MLVPLGECMTSTLRLAIFAAAIMLLGSLLYPLWVTILVRRARARVAAGLENAAADRSTNRYDVGGMVLNMYLTQFIYLLVIWNLAFKANSRQALLLVLVLTGIKLAIALKLSNLFHYGFWDFPPEYRGFISFFMWHYIGLPLS